MLTVAEYRVGEFQKKIETFNRKAAKLQLPAISYRLVDSFIKTITPVVGETEEGQAIMGDPFDIVMFNYELEGALPRINGWAFHSRVEPTEEEGVNLVYAAPGFEAVERLRSTPMICEHCNRNRRRSLVFLLQNEETGEQKIVGKSCLKDFLPDAGIENILAYLEHLKKVTEFEEDEDYGRMRFNAVYDTGRAIAEALVLIKRDGYVSKKLSAEKPDLVPTSIFMGRKGQKEEKKLYAPEELRAQFSNDELEALAGCEVRNVIDYVNSQNPDRSDFIYNLQTIMVQKACPFRMFPFVAAGVQMYIKSLEEKAKKAAKANEHLGQVGARIEFNGLTIVRITPVEGEWGTTYITGFEDEKGNSIVWFASKRLGDVGKVVNIKATVKKHDTYEERKQTVVTRAALI
jgi:hypothetical protein